MSGRPGNEKVRRPKVNVPPAMRSREAAALDRLAEVQRREIVIRYARLRGGWPGTCGPSRGERKGDTQYRDTPGTNGKVIFDSREAAEACAAELTRVLGYGPQRAYECGRSRHGHHHLTVDVNREGRRKP